MSIEHVRDFDEYPWEEGRLYNVTVESCDGCASVEFTARFERKEITPGRRYYNNSIQAMAMTESRTEYLQFEGGIKIHSADHGYIQEV